jgi:hypothetical protein
MNIFVLDKDPKLAAQYHHDMHCRKLIMESAQMLSTTIWIKDCDYAETAFKTDNIYKFTHMSHPCTIWARESYSNFVWLFNLFSSLCDEFYYRSGKIHLTQKKTWDTFNEWCNLESTPGKFVKQELTPFVQCMPDVYKCEDAVEAYRDYYKREKLFDKNMKPMDKWTNRNRPEWV